MFALDLVDKIKLRNRAISSWQLVGNSHIARSSIFISDQSGTGRHSHGRKQEKHVSRTHSSWNNFRLRLSPCLVCPTLCSHSLNPSRTEAAVMAGGRLRKGVKMIIALTTTTSFTRSTTSSTTTTTTTTTIYVDDRSTLTMLMTSTQRTSETCCRHRRNRFDDVKRNWRSEKETLPLLPFLPQCNDEDNS